jgi:hypothetical protein
VFVVEAEEVEGGGLQLVDIGGWFLVMLAAVIPATWVASTLRQRRRARERRCLNCGYDLRASGERCPECGTAVLVDPAAAAAVT